MGLKKLTQVLLAEMAEIARSGRLKGREDVIAGSRPPDGARGRRYFLEGGENREFLRLDSNSYLGLNFHPEVIAAGEAAAEKFGAGPGSVRFIHGTCLPHAELERKLATFHRRESAMIFSSAYAAVCGTIAPLVTDGTAVLSDQLNHNSIINALRMSRPAQKIVYGHLDTAGLEKALASLKGSCRRVLVISDGVFSMRGDHADLPALASAARKHGDDFEQGVITIVDDSHGTGVLGETGRGTCEATGEKEIDIVISTLGKAIGVNGGYLVSDTAVTDFLRQAAPFYIYSNPVTPAEAASAARALEIIDSPEGRRRISLLRENTIYFKKRITGAGFETLAGEHPVVPLMVRDGKTTDRLTAFLKERGILVVGLKHPVVPPGDECIRFQVSAEHTRQDLDSVIEALADFGPLKGKNRS